MPEVAGWRSPRLTLRPIALAATLLAAPLALGMGAPPASALGHGPVELPSSEVIGEPCPSGSGVTVIVDFTALLDQVRVGCAPGNQDNGFLALRSAGFTISSESGPGTICKIDGMPVEGYPYCWTTSGGFWSYWRAGEAGEWTFSNLGAGSTSLSKGSVMGWSWAAGFQADEPRIASDWAPPPSDGPDSSDDGSEVPGPSTEGSETAAGGDPSEALDREGGTPSTGPGDPSSPALDGGVEGAAIDDSPPGAQGAPTGAGDGSSGGAMELASDVGPAGDGPGSAAGVLVGAGAVVCVAGAAVFVARRRTHIARNEPGAG